MTGFQPLRSRVIALALAMALALTLIVVGAPLAQAAKRSTTTTTTAPTASVEDTQWTFSSGWAYAANQQQSGGSDHYSLNNLVGATATLRFNGTKIQYRGALDPSHGIAGIRIDGGNEVMVDLYARQRVDDSALWTSPDLPAGDHEIVVRYLARKSRRSTSTTVTVDRALVWGAASATTTQSTADATTTTTTAAPTTTTTTTAPPTTTTTTAPPATTTTTSSTTSTSPKLGVFVGGPFASKVSSFESMIGAPTGNVLVFEENGAAPEPRVGTHRMVHSPKWPLGVSASTVTTFASQLVASGQADAILRPFWEFNGPWMGWYSKGREAYFVSEWRRVVDLARSVSGQQFKFDWNPNIGDDRATVEASYPGNAYVDYIGLDIYGQDWSGNPSSYWVNAATGLSWHRTFAASKGKPRSFPEWAVTTRPTDSGGTDDDPGYVRMMSDEIKRSDVAYGCYFEFDAPDGYHSLLSGRFPNSRTELNNQF